MSSPTVLLLNMPFGILEMPSLGLGLLQARLNAAGHETRTMHLHVDFARALGSEPYQRIANDGGGGHLVGEWVFRGALFGDDETNDDAYAREVLDVRDDRQLTRAALRARALVPRFMHAAVASVLAANPRVVGLTSLFQQHVAALAMARALRVARPSLRLVLGGPGCEGEMGWETARSFPFLDAVVTGEADETIIELVERLIAGGALDAISGVLTPRVARRSLANAIPAAPRVHRLDALPVPEFGDFFEQQPAVSGAPEAIVPFETSRGCWWGARHHCVFCGLSPDLMAYRSKSTARVIAELDALAGRYPGVKFAATDNILDMKYLDGLLPALAARSLDLSLFFEVKSNLKPSQVQQLREAGVRYVQPGIESLSSELLAAMDKGVTAAQNVALLRACETYGVNPFWLIISGFPGERDSHVAAMVADFARLEHLRPPAGLTPLVVNRFSPHFQRPDAYGLHDVHPIVAYRYIYALSPEAIGRLAYYFDFSYRDDVRPPVVAPPTLDALTVWRRRYPASVLFFVECTDGGAVVDTRGAVPRVDVLSALEFEVLSACASPRAESTLRNERSAEAPSALDGALSRLDARGYIYREGGRVVAVAIRLRDFRVDDDDDRARKRDIAVRLLRDELLALPHDQRARDRPLEDVDHLL